MTTTAPADVNAPTAWIGGLTSMLFWLVLLTAAAVYSAVALAPKILHWQNWQEVYVRQRYELVDREQQLAALERMVNALDEDPKFIADLARLEMDAPEPGMDSVPVEPELQHDPRQLRAAKSAGLMATPPPPWQPWLLVLATQPALRTGLLAAAAILVVAAFTFLHDGSETARARRENLPESKLSLREFWRQRYVTRPHDPS